MVTYCSLADNWRLFLFRGLLALVLSVFAFLMPAESLLALTLVYGAFSLVDGVLSLVAAVRKIKRGRRWGWLAIRGVIGIVAGLAVLVLPLIATWVLATFLWMSIAVLSLSIGFLEILTAWRLRKEISGEIWLGLSGMLSVALGFLAIWLFATRPIESFLAAGWVVGTYAALVGVFMIMLGLRLRKAQSEQTEIEEDSIDSKMAI
ncbi:hypothetical protein GCM10007891_03410 [Methylophaga thalassica]|uniref:HdeD family acid-resistance protein n=1 Tax=Methylophaga thalassica TaxID=40223 RepID=A0ABQ5TSU1_9GAMM|nr:DUF308 domain-containing protein [Methylophaga thalassica]GLP98487.1 hypothetical protein GCM10007891_03410 [Methylophaga thalassica]